MSKTTTPKPTSANALEVMRLLQWARANHFAVHGITVGDVTITCNDIAPAPTTKPKIKPQAEEPANIYEEVGGEAWKRAQEAAAEPEPGDEDEDDD